ncbi:MAG TPA: hypothetical protein VMM60_03420 [Ilumatobacter sp.]|nr:hypothetical protein [Ilumatobacter sp.]
MAKKQVGYTMGRRNALARERGFSSYAQQRKFTPAMSSRTDLESLPPLAREARQRALDAIAVTRRERVDFAEATRREGTSPDSATWWLGDAVHRRGGRWQVAAADRLFRAMYVYSGGRMKPVDVRGSRTASSIGRYHAAVRKYLNTGDATALSPFLGKSVGGVELETDLDVLDEMGRRGEFDFESIYRMVD